MEKKFGALSSSADPSQLSATVSGLILTLGAVIIGVLGYFGVPFTDTQVGELASNAGMAAGALWALYGIIRKIILGLQSVSNR